MLLFVCCVLSAQKVQANLIDEIILSNAPILVSRKDQATNPQTDVPLKLAYSIQYFSQGEALVRYTAFFSDEDSLTSQDKTERQMGRYGRRLDIEWVFDVRFNAISGQIIAREYQCDLGGGIGHKKCKFSGKEDPVTKRPILYIITKNNIFSENPQSPYGDPNGKWIMLDPSIQIPSPYARERILFDFPELFKLSDEEIAREGRLLAPSTEYLYFRLRGVLNFGGFWIGIRDKAGNEFWSGGQQKDSALEKIGEDLWMEESFVGIRIPETLKADILQKRETLTLLFKPKKEGVVFEMKELGSYLLDSGITGYQTISLNDRIECAITNRVDSCVVL